MKYFRSWSNDRAFSSILLRATLFNCETTTKTKSWRIITTITPKTTTSTLTIFSKFNQPSNLNKVGSIRTLYTAKGLTLVLVESACKWWKSRIINSDASFAIFNLLFPPIQLTANMTLIVRFVILRSSKSFLLSKNSISFVLIVTPSLQVRLASSSTALCLVLSVLIIIARLKASNYLLCPLKISKIPKTTKTTARVFSILDSRRKK